MNKIKEFEDIYFKCCFKNEKAGAFYDRAFFYSVFGEFYDRTLYFKRDFKRGYKSKNCIMWVSWSLNRGWELEFK